MIEKRILWIDYIKGLCMIAVILNHLYAPIPYGQLTYPFELVGFFFVSGYTFNLRDSFRSFLSVKTKSLLIPIITLGTINAVLSYCIKGGTLFSRLVGICIQRPGLWDDLWFVACLFIAELIFYVIWRFIPSLFSRLFICLLLSIGGYVMTRLLTSALPWHIENACIFTLFLCLGNIIKESKTGAYLIAHSKTHKALGVLFIAIVAYILLIFTFRNYPIDVHLQQYGSFPVFMTSALFGVYVVFHLSLLLERWQGTICLRFLSYIGANTLVYYAFQSKVISLMNGLGDKIAFPESTYIGSIVYCLLACVILMLPSFLIKRYAPIILGKF